MLKGIHILLTYTCTYECDHCFLHCGPERNGTFTLEQLRALFAEIKKIESVETVYFEGGEAFMFHPLLVEGLRMTRRAGLKSGVVTNCYWATTREDARLWLEPLRELGVADLSVSDDEFHGSTEPDSPPKIARAAAEELGIPCDTICIDPQDVYHRGRAADKLIAGLPARPAGEFTTCPHEPLGDPERVHVDAFGNVHICQGISMGNMWVTPLSRLVREYEAARHPICGPLVAGGPAQLARQHGLELSDGFVDECHYCYAARRALLPRFPELLAPKEVYGLP